jgi:hypothetical protein
MTVRTHLNIYLILFFVFFGLGFGVYFMLLVFLGNVPGWLQPLLLVTALIVAALVHRFIFHYLIGAACPQCKGKCFPTTRKSWEIVYKCTSCSFSYHTGVFQEGSAD